MSKKSLLQRSMVVVAIATMATVFCSCLGTQQVTRSICYQSVRKLYAYPQVGNPTIEVATFLDPKGNFQVKVTNLSDEIMTIDQQKSFVVNTDGKSTSYYDPTVRVESTATTESNTSGGSVNLGAVAGALGVGGVAGQLLNGVNVGEANTAGVTNTTTTYFSDQPQVSLAPKGSSMMSKTFNIIDVAWAGYREQYKMNDFEHASRFSVCISYSVDGGKTYQKFEQWFYINADICQPVSPHGRLNDALRTIMQRKTDCLNEPWWVFFTKNTADDDRCFYSNTLSVDRQ